MQKQKLRYISFAYAVGCVLVVLGHSYPLGGIPAPSVMETLQTGIYLFHMPLFFFISGFLMKHSGSIAKKGYKTFVLQKAKQLLIPYLIFSMAGYIPKLLVSGYISDKVDFSFNYVVRFLFVPRENVWGHFWFIPTLFIIYLLAGALIIFASKHNNRTVQWSLPFAIISASLLLNLFPIRTGWFSLSDVSSFGIYFALGYFGYHIVQSHVQNKPMIFFLCAANYLLFLAARISSPIPTGFMLIPAICMIVLVFAGGKEYEKRNWRFLDFLDGKTFTVFLLSWPFQAAVEILLNKMLHLNWYLVFVCMFAAGISFPLIVFHFVSRLPHGVRRYSWIIGMQEQ